MKSGRLMTARHEAFILMRAFQKTLARIERWELEDFRAGRFEDAAQRAGLRQMRDWNLRRLDAAQELLRPEDHWRIERLRLEAGIVVRYLRQLADGRWLRVLGT